MLLDVDGTLLEIAPSPSEVVVPMELPRRLARLRTACGGALALVSGRTLADLDALFGPLGGAAIGAHGLEVRHATGTLRAIGNDASAALERVRRALAERARAWVGARVEDKGVSLAVHYRAAPRFAGAIERAMAAFAGDEPTLRLLRGKCVVELLPVGRDKGAALADLMASAPFVGRVPVFAGDDVTDESAIAWVNAVGGVSIHVGAASTPSQARVRLPSVAAVHAWLERLDAATPC